MIFGRTVYETHLDYIIKKTEAHAVVKVFDRVDHILCGANQVQISTHLSNLLSVPVVFALRLSASTYILSEIQIWAIYLLKIYLMIK